MVSSMTEENVQQNLIDAGCGPELIQRYMAAMKADDFQRCSRLLNDWRRVLLADIHAGEKKLDCLDYLRYHLQKKENLSWQK